MKFDGVELDVIDEGSGPAIVLLHGFPLAKETWDAQAATLAARARVIRFDLRGLGKSSVPGGPYLMETLAGDVSDVLDALGVKRATIVGHSLGGYVALAFYRVFTERCAGLGLVATRANADDAATALAREELALRAEREGIAPVVDTYLPRCFAPEVYRERPELVARARAIIEATDPAGAVALVRGMAMRVSSEDLLGEIDVPVSWVAGRFDDFVPLEHVQATVAAIRSAALDVLDCGHFPLYETPDALGEALATLLTRTDRAAR